MFRSSLSQIMFLVYEENMRLFSLYPRASDVGETNGLVSATVTSLAMLREEY
jgi:hypothetical protein